VLRPLVEVSSFIERLEVAKEGVGRQPRFMLFDEGFQLRVHMSDICTGKAGQVSSSPKRREEAAHLVAGQPFGLEESIDALEKVELGLEHRLGM